MQVSRGAQLSAAYTRRLSPFQPICFIRRITALSERDIRWLQALSLGASVKELPEITSEQVAKNRLSSIRQFLGARNTTHAVAEALRRGIIQ